MQLHAEAGLPSPGLLCTACFVPGRGQQAAPPPPRHTGADGRGPCPAGPHRAAHAVVVLCRRLCSHQRCGGHRRYYRRGEARGGERGGRQLLGRPRPWAPGTAASHAPGLAAAGQRRPAGLRRGRCGARRTEPDLGPGHAGGVPSLPVAQVRRALEEHDEMSNMPGMKTVIKTGERGPPRRGLSRGQRYASRRPTWPALEAPVSLRQPLARLYSLPAWARGAPCSSRGLGRPRASGGLAGHPGPCLRCADSAPPRLRAWPRPQRSSSRWRRLTG